MNIVLTTWNAAQAGCRQYEQVHSLARHLAARGHRITIIAPKPDDLPEPEPFKRKRQRINITCKGKPAHATLVEMPTQEGVETILIEFPPEALSPDPAKANGDSDPIERLAGFCRGVLDTIVACDITPDVIHCLGWQTGPIPALLQFEHRERKSLNATGTLFGIPDLSQAGLFPPEAMTHLGLGWDLFTPTGFEFLGKVGFLKAGLAFADKIIVPSRTYAQAIQGEPHGRGLASLITDRSQDLRAIPFGVDEVMWNPAGVLGLAADNRFDVPASKQAARTALRQRLEISDNPDRLGILWPIDGEQKKHIEFFCQTADAWLALGVQWVVACDSNEAPLSDLRELFSAHAGAGTVIEVQDRNRWRDLYAGSELIIAPPRFPENPCHIVRAAAFGCLPLLHASGSLSEMVDDIEEQGHGFLFQHTSLPSIAQALKRAIAVVHDPVAWQEVLGTCLGLDFSWALPARRIEALYRKVAQMRDPSLKDR